jgi:glutathionylspermidine synthase
MGIPEDLDQMLAHERAIRLGVPWAVTSLGAIGDVEARDGRAWLHGDPVDLLFRYHPLDWFADEPALMSVLDLSASGRLAMLPPAHAVVPQSKAFLALLWELCRQDFFPAAEAAAVRAHVPFTVLDPSRLGRRPYVVKPYLEREGHGVRFSSELGARERRQVAAAEVVYQERLDLARLRVPVATADGWRDEERVLVFGVFLAGDRVAGAYTRAGAAITGREAVFVPLVLT